MAVTIYFATAIFVVKNKGAEYFRPNIDFNCVIILQQQWEFRSLKLQQLQREEQSRL